MKFKIGDKIVPKEEGSWNDCAATLAATFFGLTLYAIVTNINKNGYRYDVYDENGTRTGHCYGCIDDTNSKLMEKTMENVQVGDLISVEDGDIKKVLAVLPGVVLLSTTYYDEADGWYTHKEIDNKGWTIKTDEPELTELTLKEVADKLNIDVDALRIKDN